MTEALEKALALKEHLGEPYFVVYNEEDHELDVAYEGREDTCKPDYNLYIREYGTHRIDPQSYEEWLDSNIHQVEEYDEAGNDYLVLTDDEANDRWNEYLDNVLEECILPDLPEFARNYFDSERWKEDAREDGRGESISHYNGKEHEININGTYYYIYRIN